MSISPRSHFTPADIEDIGLDGFGRFGNGEFRFVHDDVARRAAFLNKPEAEVRAALDAAGWIAGYVTNLGLPAESGNPESRSTQIAFTSIYQYADQSGAEAAFEFNRQYDAVSEELFEVLEGTRTLGDASYITHTVSAESGDDRPSRQLDVSVRRGNVIAATGWIVFTDAGDGDTLTDIGPAEIALIESMGARLVERVDRARSGASPGLAQRTLRFATGDEPIAFSTEGYRRLDGDDPPYYGGYADDFPGDNQSFAPVSAAYEINQGLALPGDPYYVTRLLQFGTAQDAAAYLADVRAAGGSPLDTSAEPVEGPATLGDDAVMFRYEAQPEPGVTVVGYAIYARAGTTAFMLALDSAGDEPNAGAVADLALSQLACLGDEPCPARPVPEQLFRDVAECGVRSRSVRSQCDEPGSM